LFHLVLISNLVLIFLMLLVLFWIFFNFFFKFHSWPFCQLGFWLLEFFGFSIHWVIQASWPKLLVWKISLTRLFFKVFYKINFFFKFHPSISKFHVLNHEFDMLIRVNSSWLKFFYVVFFLNFTFQHLVGLRIKLHYFIQFVSTTLSCSHTQVANLANWLRRILVGFFVLY